MCLVMQFIAIEVDKAWLQYQIQPIDKGGGAPFLVEERKQEFSFSLYCWTTPLNGFFVFVVFHPVARDKQPGLG